MFDWIPLDSYMPFVFILCPFWSSYPETTNKLSKSFKWDHDIQTYLKLGKKLFHRFLQVATFDLGPFLSWHDNLWHDMTSHDMTWRDMTWQKMSSVEGRSRLASVSYNEMPPETGILTIFWFCMDFYCFDNCIWFCCSIFLWIVFDEAFSFSQSFMLF